MLLSTLQDAHNLSWKLGLVAQGIAGDRFLESYSAERHPVGLDVVEQTSPAMDESIASASTGRVGQGRESQLFINYRSGAWVQDEVAENGDEPGSPRAGDRAPDATGLGRPFARIGFGCGNGWSVAIMRSSATPQATLPEPIRRGSRN
ncbi:MAG TPA: FAD-dependent monooxygenase [Chthoniobacterales bacterium]|nr:FAD-dependent monooxygenase [Chthoniobacterales bacterium]